MHVKIKRSEISIISRELRYKYKMKFLINMLNVILNGNNHCYSNYKIKDINFRGIVTRDILKNYKQTYIFIYLQILTMLLIKSIMYMYVVAIIKYKRNFTVS